MKVLALRSLNAARLQRIVSEALQQTVVQTFLFKAPRTADCTDQLVIDTLVESGCLSLQKIARLETIIPWPDLARRIHVGYSHSCMLPNTCVARTFLTCSVGFQVSLWASVGRFLERFPSQAQGIPIPRADDKYLVLTAAEGGHAHVQVAFSNDASDDDALAACVHAEVLRYLLLHHKSPDMQAGERASLEGLREQGACAAAALLPVLRVVLTREGWDLGRILLRPPNPVKWRVTAASS
jgi:hypothetical protein